MNGYVDTGGRALIDVTLSGTEGSIESTVTTWIDTGFTGDLVLPDSAIEALQLPLSGTVGAVLADGSKVAMRVYACQIRWFDEWQPLEVIASDAQYPLLGVGLLRKRELRINYDTNQLSLL